MLVKKKRRISRISNSVDAMCSFFFFFFHLHVKIIISFRSIVLETNEKKDGENCVFFFDRSSKLIEKNFVTCEKYHWNDQITLKTYALIAKTDDSDYSETISALLVEVIKCFHRSLGKEISFISQHNYSTEEFHYRTTDIN